VKQTPQSTFTISGTTTARRLLPLYMTALLSSGCALMPKRPVPAVCYRPPEPPAELMAAPKFERRIRECLPGLNGTPSPSCAPAETLTLK
jgi:hypothetical protein